MRAGTEAVRRYEEYRRDQKIPDQVLEIRYDKVILKIFRIIMYCLIMLLPVLGYFSWDTIKNDDSGKLFLLYEFDFAYLFVTIVIFFQYLRMKKWRIIRTETSIISFSLFHKREVSYQELQEAARNNPVKQKSKGLCFSTRGTSFFIPLTDTVPNSLKFCMQIAMEAHITLPRIKRNERKKNIRVCGILTALVPIILGNLYLYADNKQRAIGILVIAMIAGVVAVGLLIASCFLGD